MKKMITLLALAALISGCAVSNLHIRMKNTVERSRRISEERFNYSYKDVFSAIVQLLNDGAQVIYEKDFEKGVIMVSGGATFELAVGVSYGFWLEKINDKETKVILKIDERNVRGGGYLVGLTVKDFFDRLENELGIQEKLRKN